MFAVAACTPGVIRPPVVVPMEVASTIDSVRIELLWPEVSAELGGFATSQSQAAAEGAGSAAEQAGNAWLDSVFINECAEAECIAIPLLLPIILPLAAIGNAAFSDSAEEIAAQQATVVAALTDFEVETLLRETLQQSIEARTPYLVTESAEADAVLTVSVMPLEVSGENLERQDVRVIMAFDVRFDQQSGQEPRQIYYRLYRKAYGVTNLRDLAENIEEFQGWLSQAARANAFAIAEDLYTGFDSNLQKFEVIEPAVNIVSLLGGAEPFAVDSVIPELIWTPVPNDAVDIMGPGSKVIYDVRVFEFEDAPQSMSHVDFDERLRAQACDDCRACLRGKRI